MVTLFATDSRQNREVVLFGRGWTKIVMPMLVGGLVLAATASTASAAAGPCAASTPQYCPAPVATTGAAVNVTVSSAIVTGTVNPNGAQASCTFSYGVGSTQGMLTAFQTIPAGTSAVPVAAQIVGLEATTTFQYTLVCITGGGTGSGSTASFTTLDHGPSRVGITGHSGYVSSSRKVTLILGCFGDRSCSGKLTLKRKGKQIASATFNLKANTGHTVSLRVSKKIFGKLKNGSLKVTAKAAESGGNTVTATIRLHRFI